ncbi:hypothetical protein WJX73_000147 [Symbiochloris irregularis]|uniref:Uncharacterized protein n=1 Tax=Symbiochloris irregularis TaxID=706552 RepID=A0AAW1NWM2_9CHLO
MDAETLDAFQQKWEAVADTESAASAGLSEKAQRQQRLSLACTLAKEYLALGLPPPPSTAALTGHALEHYRKHKLQRKPRATAEVLEKLREALTAQESLLRTQRTVTGLQLQEQGSTIPEEEPPPPPETELRRSRSRKSGSKAARRQELQAAVQKLRDALLTADAEAGQEAADQVAMLLRASAPSAHKKRSPSPRTPRKGHGHNAPASARGQLYSEIVQKRDAANSPPPRGLDTSADPEPSLRFRTRPEWDDTFHLLNKPTTPRPANKNVAYTVDPASVGSNHSSAAHKLSMWRNAKRIEMARSLSPRREVPVSLSLMNSALRGQSNLRPSTLNMRTPRLPGSKSQRSTSRLPTSSPRKDGIPAQVSGFQAEQLRRVGELEHRMSRLIAAVEQRLATAA